METIKVKYIGPGGVGYYGIPARDLSNEDWERLTPEQREVVATSPLYQMVKAETKAKEE